MSTRDGSRMRPPRRRFTDHPFAPEQFSLGARHLLRVARALVIVTEAVQEAVREQPLQLASDRPSALARLPRSGLQRDHDIADRPARARRVTPLFLRKREHVGRLVLAAVLAVERADRAI